ncbi:MULTISPECIES: replication protein P [Pantoea]|uniref:Replication protein P n=1 Tax=Pantoea piersonii TaxID=2364647 RepID=A0AAJ5QMZ6_9GAMM|nr:MULTISPECIES: replication protein P [Pantoea]MDU6432249.1 replication protein P [Pantoea sp.]RTY60509.1 hypothetical protein EKL29_04320 [Pantoea sp. YU22]WBG92529.1 replication protein P [Pantoea piersonii]
MSGCKGGENGAAGLPDGNTLYDMVMRYSARRGLYHSPEAYPWQANADYWMVTGPCAAGKALRTDQQRESTG